jgi:hypothetical protein
LTFFWVVVSAVLGAGLVRGVLYPSHPGKLRFTFGVGPEEREARARLREVRQKCGQRRSEARQGVADVRRGIADGVRPLGERVRELREEQAGLRQEVRGERVAELGRLRLYEHCLVWLAWETPEGGEPRWVEQEPDLPLDGLTVDDHGGHDNVFILLMPPSGPRGRVAYARSQYDETSVYAFYDLIRDELPKDAEFRARRRRRDAEITAEVERIRADSSAIERAGRRDLAAAEKHLRAELAAADADLGIARDAWKELAGLRPWW